MQIAAWTGIRRPCGHDRDKIGMARNLYDDNQTSRYRVFALLIFLSLILLIQPSQAQTGSQNNEEPDVTGVSGESYFKRQLDQFSWRYLLDFRHRPQHDAFDIRFKNSFTSRFYLLNGDVQSIQDSNTARLNARIMLSRESVYGLALEASSLRVSNTNLQQDYAMAGPLIRHQKYIPLQFSLLGGYLQEERSQNQDSGPMVGVRAGAPAYEIGELMLNSEVYINYADIDPRELHTYRFKTNSRMSADDFRMNADLKLARNIRESYQSDSFFNRGSSDFIESIKTDTTAVSGTAWFPLSPAVDARLDIGGLRYLRRTINRSLATGIEGDEAEDALIDTRVLRQELDLRMEARYEMEIMELSGGLDYNLGTRTGQLQNASQLSSEQVLQQNEQLINSNFEQQQFGLFSESRLQLHPDNTTRLNGRISIFNYDTPEINRDDRDELNVALSLSNRHRFQEAFQTRLLISAEGRHTVYLFSERSIQNNWRRSLRLAPGIDWQILPWLHTYHDFLVRANYTVYDFQSESEQNNDQVSREFKAGSRFEIDLAPDWQLDMAFSRSELRIGRLLWDEFREIPTDTLVTYDTRLSIRMQKAGIRSSVGLRYFLKLEYLPATTINAENPDLPGETVSRTGPGRQQSLQWGPTVDLRLPLYARNELYISGWYQIQRIKRRLYTEYPEQLRETFRAAEDKAQISIFPNIEIRARFRF